MKTYVRYILMSAITLLFMGSCSNDSEPDKDVMSDNTSIYATSNMMVTADNVGDDDTDDSAPIIIDEFSSGDLLYFSQMSQSANPNFDDQNESANNYMYIYQYRANPKATWESGENFVNYGNRLSFTWDQVLEVGPSGNAFKFFAFYFPEDNSVRWSVETDQTGGEENPYDQSNFKKSDIMGAYHATSSIFTRMRFRLFHLMTYLKVTLYVPVYKAEYSEPDKQNYSGFDAKALKGGFLMNALTEFNIEWATSKSSDTEAPFVQTPTDRPRSNIKMYRHKDNEDVIKDDLYVKQFYTGTVDGITDDYDEVRTYNFSVLFPTQSFGDNFLCFALTTPGGDTKYYYFSGSQIVGADGNSYGLTQGTLQQLYLYLPRKTNQTVLVAAKILPWQNAQTDMTVTKKEKND